MLKRYFTGLCMCWGNFCFIPGLKRWDEKAKSLMLGWLPTVGLAIGLVWVLCYFAMVYLNLPYLLVSFAMAFLPFILSGFMHVDGFMDCSDALLSRGDLEKKQRILKDSTCGSFAVVTMIFTVLCFYSCLGSAISYGIDFVNLLTLTVVARSVSGLEVLLSKPMKVSQYVRMHGETKPQEETEAEAVTEEKASTIGQGIVLLVIQLVIYMGIVVACSSDLLSTVVVAVATALGTFISCTIAKRSLGGMNGDIAGYGIVWGEMMGVIALAII